MSLIIIRNLKGNCYDYNRCHTDTDKAKYINRKTVFSVGIYEMSNPEKVSLNSMTVTLVFIDNNSFQMHGFMKTWHLIYPGSDITLAPGLISS